MSDLTTLLRRLPVASPLPFDLNARPVLALELSDRNTQLRGFDPGDTPAFSAWVRAQLEASGADYAAGGYGEDRGGRDRYSEHREASAPTPVAAGPGPGNDEASASDEE